ncbi:MAG: D-alanyl-D-alanine carboxypeptidase family protein [Oscillospiraceae bacterium]|nr:D-alanyl-D-alanine carboxypeptidase family protein [Oscillospiraceae bacterium]
MKKSKVFSWICLLAVLISVLAPSAYAVEDAPGGKSTAIYLADAKTDAVYYERSGEAKLYPASLTKIMTALLVVEAVNRGDVSLDDMVTAEAGFDHDMIADGSTSGISLGETMSLHDLLYCTLLASANEACNIVAMYLCGDIPTFVDRMNQRAQELGCTGTHFANPHGLPDDNHYTTPHDMYRIAKQAMSYELFKTICGTAEYTVAATNMSPARTLQNTNGLINPNSEMYRGYSYDYAKGIKTGHTNAAGFCLVSAAEKDGVDLICVAMGGVQTEKADGTPDYSNFSDTVALYNWAFSNYSCQELVAEDELITEVPVALGSDADSVPLRAQKTITAVLPNDADLSNVKKTITIYGEDHACTAPIQAGEILGELTVSIDGVDYGTTYLEANRSVDLSHLQAMGATVSKTLHNPWVLVALFLVFAVIIGYAVLVIRYRILYRKRQKELQQARLQRQQMQEQADRERMFSNARQKPHRVPRQGETQTDSKPKSDVTRDYFEEFFKDDK